MNLLTRFASIALLAGTAVTGNAATPLLNLIGDQAPLVISFNDLPSMRKAWGDSPWAKTWNDEQVRKFFAPLHAQTDFDKIEAEIKANTGHSIDELVAFATGDALIAFTSVDIDFESDDAVNTIPFIAAIELGSNASKVEKMIADARAKNPGATHETEEFAGVTIHIDTPEKKAKAEAEEGEEGEDGEEEGEGSAKQDGPDHIVWAITDGVWLVGFNTQSVTAAIDALKKGGVDNAYGKSAHHLATVEKSGPAHFSFALNFKAIVSRAQEEIAKKAAATEQTNPFLNPVAIIPALGLDAWNALYLNVNFTEAQTTLTGGFTFSEERGLLKMFSYGPGPVARPSFVPAKWLTVSSAKFSLKNFYSGLEEMLGAYNPGVLGMGQMYVQNLNQQLGIDIKRDFFGSFGSDLISAYAPRPGATAANPASLEELDQFVGFSLDNPKSFSAALDALMKMGGPQAEQMIVKRDYLGSTINTIAMPNADASKPAKSVSYAVAKNYLFLSIGTPAAIESVLQDGPSFWDRREVKQALSGVPGEASSVTYQGTSALMGAVFQSLVDLAKNPAMQEQAPVDASAAPDANTLSKYWGDAVGYMTRDSQGYFFKSTLEHKK
jgi:hypothetical protein